MKFSEDQIFCTAFYRSVVLNLGEILTGKNRNIQIDRKENILQWLDSFKVFLSTLKLL